MALIPWYSGLRITNLNLIPSVPGQITHEIPSTGAVRTFNAGAGRWSGTIQFGRIDSEEQGLRTEAFIAGLNGSHHTTDIPLERIKGFESSDTTLAEAAVGRYYNYGSRLVVIHGREGGNTRLWPELNIAESDTLTSATLLRIRLTGAQAVLRQEPEIWGPWVLSFTEAIT